MKNLKISIMIALVIILGCGCWASRASAETVKKIILFKDGVTQQMRSEYAEEWSTAGVVALMDLPYINGLVVGVPDLVSSAELAGDYRVASVQEDQPVELQAISAAGEGGAGEGGAGEGGATQFITRTATPTTSERPWGILSQYNLAYDLWAPADYFNKNQTPELVKQALDETIHVKVAILDTGADFNHDKIKGYIKGGIDLVHLTPGIPMDDNGHGTHIAGTLTAKELGLAFRVWLYAVKVLDQNATGDVSTLLMALQWCIDNNMDVINMSLAFTQDHPAVRLAIEKAHEAGLIMVAAAGNHSNWVDDGASGEGGAGEGGAGEGGAGEGGAVADGTTSSPYPVMYPAAYPEVIAVGAHDSFKHPAAFSNYGPELDILAPGTAILSTGLAKSFGTANGTSMATPHVTGAIVLMKSLAIKDKKTIGNDDLRSILKQTAVDGTLNLLGALNEVKLWQ